MASRDGTIVDVGLAPAPTLELGADDLVERDGVDALGVAALAGGLEQVLEQRPELLALADEVAQQRCALLGGQVRVAREHFEVRADRRHGRAQLVRGVGDQLALRPL